MSIGRAVQIWRYPVKSMMGETIDATILSTGGIPGDRGWAVRDEARGAIQGARKIAGLMQLAARFDDEPDGGHVPPAVITLPDGNEVRTDDANAAALVSAVVGRSVTLWPLRSADDLDHYRRAPFDSEDIMAELREIFARDSDAELPDLSGMPPEVFEYETPPGTYFDAYPLLLVTEQTLATLARLAPDSHVDVRRFRPNLVVHTASAEPFPEQSWVGRHLQVGDAVVEVVTPCPRCVAITRPFADLPEDRALVKTVVREADHCVGVYARVVEPGSVARGDPVRLV